MKIVRSTVLFMLTACLLLLGCAGTSSQSSTSAATDETLEHAGGYDLGDETPVINMAEQPARRLPDSDDVPIVAATSDEDIPVAEPRRVLRSGGWVLWYDAARTRGRDPHFRPVPRNEVESLFPGVRWHWQRLSSDLGLLRRVADVLGEPGMQALDATGLFRTHLLGLGRLA